MAADISLEDAASVGRLLGLVNAASARCPDLADAFADRSFFDELRIDPYMPGCQSRRPTNDMTDEITLRGITWDHPRGLDPLLASSDQYRDIEPAVQIEWTTRSLSGFGEDPLVDLAASYDLLIIDHPFVGDAAASTAFQPLDRLASVEVLAERSRTSVGPSHASYSYGGHQWALALDAAAQVSAVHQRYATTALPTTWDEVFELAARMRREGSWMSVPMWPADLCVATYTIGRGMGLELFTDGRVFPSGQGRRVLATLQRLTDAAHPDGVTWNPPAVLDQMRDGVVHYCPILFGYSNYSRPGSGDLILFGDIPTATGSPSGSVLGGAGIAISSACAAPTVAMDFAAWVTSAEVQAGIYFRAGGQPGRRDSWVDESINAASSDFFRRTLATLEGAWIRPRIAGYQAFQKGASTIVADHIIGSVPAHTTLDALDDLWRSVERAAGI